MLVPSGKVKSDVGGQRHALWEHPQDPIKHALPHRDGQFKKGRDRRQVAHVVASRHRRSTVDRGLTHIHESVGLSEFGPGPLHRAVLRCLVRRGDAVVCEKRRSGGADSLLDALVG